MKKTIQQEATPPPYKELAKQLLLHHDDNNETIEQYIKVIEEGLPRTGAFKKKEILIVGAGITGLLLGKLLRDQGHDIKIIEANANRVGGRIKTFKDKFENPLQYGEAGAMRIPDSHPLVKTYMAKYKIKTQEFYNVDVERIPRQPYIVEAKRGKIRCNGIQQTQAHYDKNPIEMNKGFGSRQIDNANVLLNRVLDPVRDLFSEVKNGKRVNFPYDKWLAGWAKVIEKYDEYSMRRFLKECPNPALTENDIALIGTIVNLTSRMPLAFMHSFLGRSVINPNVKYQEVVNGFDNFYKPLEEELCKAGVICKGQRMTHLDFYQKGKPHSHHVSPDGCHVSIRTLSESKVNENGEEKFKEKIFKGDLAVVTIPFSSLRFVRTTPDFSYGKRRAIIELHYDAATKIFLEFNQRWWEFSISDWIEKLRTLLKSGKITQDDFFKHQAELKDIPPRNSIGGSAITDNPNRFSYFPSHPVKGPFGGVVLASYTWADDARRWDSMDDGQRYQFALSQLAVLHGERIKLFYTGDGHAKTQSWARNPYAFGEAAVFTPGQLTALHPHIPTIEGPIYFGGEHTSLKHAWIEGSLESAVRVALEICPPIKS